MKQISSAIVLTLLILAPASRMPAQLLNKTAPVVVGHYHLNVTSIEEHKKFWVDTLGGTAIKFGPERIDVIKFPDVFLFLRVQRPTGPTRGTAFDHIGFAVPDVPKAAAKAVANGYQLTVGREPGPGQTVSPPTAGNYGRFAYLVGPERCQAHGAIPQVAGARQHRDRRHYGSLGNVHRAHRRVTRLVLKEDDKNEKAIYLHVFCISVEPRRGA